jgi:hypothetical protein
MIYIVSGFMRSGTSMMMRALEAGGMQVARSLRRDVDLNRRFADVSGPEPFVPNEAYYELDEPVHLVSDFPRAYDGQLVKALYYSLPLLPTWEYRIIFMRRAATDIRTSMLAAFNDQRSMAWSEPVLNAHLDRLIEVLRDRRSVKTLDVVQYEDVLGDPLRVFKALDWPINAIAAADVPRPSARRFQCAS